jgi:predicted lipid-binding transport protein (Tim44 family)
MSILTSIFDKIFPHDHPANTASASTTAPAASPPSATPASAAAPASAGASPEAAAAVQPPVAAAPAPVDVEAVLTAMQAKTSEQLNWRTSIVDLLKLLGLDSSLSARKELASELHYDGDTNDSASMNVWLHKQVMQKLADNGGKLPADLKA